MSNFRELEPCFVRDRLRLTADGGATSRERKNVFRCECGAYVAWYTTKRTHKTYLVNCFSHLNSDDLWYAANSPHFTTCALETRNDQ